jgi:hypothetical protein
VRAKLTSVTSGGTSGDPARLDGRPRQPTIKRHPALCDDEWVRSDDPLVESLVNLRAFISQNALSHVHTRISQSQNALSRVTRIYINRTDNDISNTGAEYRICARSSATNRGTRLQGDIQRAPRGHRCTEIAEALYLSVLAPRFPMAPFRYYAVVDY